MNQIEAASFTGMTKLRELKMPEQITKVPSYAFAKCTVLSKVTFSKNNAVNCKQCIFTQ